MHTRVRLSITLILLACALSPEGLSAGFFSRKPKKPVLVFGIEKSIYDTLTEEQRKQIIDVHNAHQSYRDKQEAEVKVLQQKIEALQEELKQIAVLEKDKLKLTSQLEKLQTKLDTQEKALNSILSVSEDLVTARTKGKNYEEREKREKFLPKIANIHRGFNSTTIELDNDTTMEISPFEKEKIETWMNGQTVELTKGDGLVYVLHLQNLDTQNGVSVKIKEKPVP